MNMDVAGLVASLNMAVDTFAGLHALLEELQQEMDRLAQDKYASVPTPLWEDRQGKGRYLRLQFRQDANGQRRRIYVGCDPDRIAAAEQTMANTQRWLDLRRQREEIAGWAGHLLRALHDATRQADGLRQKYLPTRADATTGPVVSPAPAPAPSLPRPAQAVRSVTKLVTLRALVRLLPDDAAIMPWFYHLQNAVETGVRRWMQTGAVAEILAPEHWAHLVSDMVDPAPLSYAPLHQALQDSLRELLGQPELAPAEEVAA